MGFEFGGTRLPNKPFARHSVKPKLIKLANLIDISLKWTHILALTTNGELYAWGENYNGECGMKSNCYAHVDKPTRVRGIEAYHIRQISAGAMYSLLRCAPKSQ